MDWTAIDSSQGDPSSNASAIVSGKVYLAGGLAPGDNASISADDVLGTAYLTFDLDDPAERKMMGAYALADLASRYGRFVEPGASESVYRIIIAGHAFGRGSARPHSAIALYEAGVRVVLARSFYEPFRRVAVGEGLLLPLVMGAPVQDELKRLQTGDEVHVDVAHGRLIKASDQTLIAALEPAGVMLDILKAGGLFASSGTH